MSEENGGVLNQMVSDAFDSYRDRIVQAEGVDCGIVIATEDSPYEGEEDFERFRNMVDYLSGFLKTFVDNVGVLAEEDGERTHLMLFFPDRHQAGLFIGIGCRTLRAVWRWIRIQQIYPNFTDRDIKVTINKPGEEPQEFWSRSRNEDS